MKIVIATALMPLFFMILLTTTLVSASHAPRPHQLPLTVAGPAAVTEQVRTALAERTGEAFQITTTTDLRSARLDVADRDAVGAILIEDGSVTLVEASAGGLTAAAVVQRVGSEIAAQLGTTATVEDVAPLADGDETGTVLFFLFVACTVGGFLSIVGPSQVRPVLSTRTMLTTNVVAAVVIPVVAYAVLSFFVGDFDASVPTLAAVLGVAALYTFTIGLLASLFHQIIGVAGVFLVMIFAVGFNLPSSGGTSPESMLPAFWQGLHQFWVGAGGYEAMRSILYFDGAGAAAYLGRLLVWTAALIMLVLGTAFRTRRRHPGGEHPPMKHHLEAASGVTST